MVISYSMKIKEQTRKLAAGCTWVRQGDVDAVWIWFSKSIIHRDQSLYRDRTTQISDWLCMCGSGWSSICIVCLLSLF